MSVRDNYFGGAEWWGRQLNSTYYYLHFTSLHFTEHTQFSALRPIIEDGYTQCHCIYRGQEGKEWRLCSILISFFSPWNCKAHLIQVIKDLSYFQNPVHRPLCVRESPERCLMLGIKHLLPVAVWCLWGENVAFIFFSVPSGRLPRACLWIYSKRK